MLKNLELGFLPLNLSASWWEEGDRSFLVLLPGSDGSCDYWHLTCISLKFEFMQIPTQPCFPMAVELDSL